ncbi:hypothetical protein PRZ48_005724 [Zasmidium cellare]|uniref:Uncharacterized protein n=1 Tax=Zasmidium cellare TaxID=395010 RepID=A0ABR0EL39_ZASCE|nr:hypothetical protein PRZ48_005724 [Zasmidium cellare]
MSAPPLNPQPPNFVRLFDQGLQLERAINNIERAYALLMSRYVALPKGVVGNPAIMFRYRMTCQFAFSPGDSAYIPTAVTKLKTSTKDLEASLLRGDLNGSEKALGSADVELRKAEIFLEQLEEAIDAHALLEQWMRSRELINDEEVKGRRPAARIWHHRDLSMESDGSSRQLSRKPVCGNKLRHQAVKSFDNSSLKQEGYLHPSDAIAGRSRSCGE